MTENKKDMLLKETKQMNGDTLQNNPSAEEFEEIARRDFEISCLKHQIELLKRKEGKRMIDEDLKVIQKLDPHISSVNDMGELFIMLRANGYNAKDAYDAVCSLNSKKEISQMGDVAMNEEEKDFFTKEEVKAMSKSQVKKNYDKIRKSMSKWK